MNMQATRKFTRDEIFILGTFIAILAVVALLFITGEVWVITTTQQMSVWIIFASVFLAVMGGVVATYSFVAYMQKPDLRFIVLGFLGVDIIFIAFAFLFTHPSSAIWLSTFPDRQRNRSIAIIFGMALIPSVLSGAFKGEVPLVKTRQWLFSIWGGLIVPAFVFWFSLSPEVVIISTDTSSSGGLFSATTAGLFMIVIVMIAFVVSFMRYLIEWFRGGDRIILASSLSLIIWIISLVLLGILSDSLQTLEIVWYTLMGCGFLIIAIAMMVSVILEPHSILNELVDDRTRKLEISERESEFYLDMWSHKIGNILQGMLTYLELLSEKSHIDRVSTIQSAFDLGKEANLVNRQVINLIKIKQSKNLEMGPVDLKGALLIAAKNATEFQENRELSIEIGVDQNVNVDADDLLDLLFLSLFIHAAKKEETEDLKIVVDSQPGEDSLVVSVTCSCRALSPEAANYLSEEGLPSLTQLGLELFTVKLLLMRYGCQLQCKADDNGENLFLISFKKE